MMLKNLLNYLKYSGVWISFALNPYHWRLCSGFQKPDDMDPALYSVVVICGPITIRVVLDDGSW